MHGRKAGCPFCGIVARDVEARHVDLDVPGFAAFFDHKPQSKTHVIVATKAHIESFAAGSKHPDRVLLAEAFTRAMWNTAEKLGLTKYRVIVNNNIGRVSHMHAHIISRQKVRI